MRAPVALLSMFIVDVTFQRGLRVGVAVSLGNLVVHVGGMLCYFKSLILFCYRAACAWAARCCWAREPVEVMGGMPDRSRQVLVVAVQGGLRVGGAVLLGER